MNTTKKSNGTRRPHSSKKNTKLPKRRTNYQSITEQREQQLREQLSQHAFRTTNIGVRYYDLEPKGGRLEDILKKSNVKARYNEEARNYTTLIDDFDFPTETNSLAMTPDGKYIMATGSHAPRMKCFDLEQLSMKFERHTDNEIIKILPLSNDFRKFALLQRNRWVEFHAQFGRYYNLRLPKEGRDIVYHRTTCELLAVGNSDEIQRFDLEQGTFRQPLQLASGTDAINCIKISPVHQLFGAGCENGFVECIDPRSRTVAGVLDACQIIQDTNKDVKTGTEITSLQFDPRSSVHFAVGTDMGQVALFDLRKHGAIFVKDHHYETPIRTIDFHDITDNIISSDQKVIKIWNKNTGNNFLNIEFPRIIHDVLVIPESGMIMCGGGQPFVKPYYVPSLGPAPKWCSFIDSITEELEEVKKMSVHQDFKFVTLDDLRSLGLDSLIGSTVLRPYLHGFFMKMELYKKAVAFHTTSNGNIENVEEGEELNDGDIEERIEKRWSESQIKKRSAVSDSDDDEEDEKDKHTKRNQISSVFDDQRFKVLLNRPEFQINESKKQKIEDKRLSRRMKEQQTLEHGYTGTSEQTMKEVHGRKALSYGDSDISLRGSKRQKKTSFEERIRKESANDDVLNDRKRFRANQEVTIDVSELKQEKPKKKVKPVHTLAGNHNDNLVNDEQAKTVIFKQKDRERRGAEKLLPKMKIRGGKPRSKK